MFPFFPSLSVLFFSFLSHLFVFSPSILIVFPNFFSPQAGSALLYSTAGLAWLLRYQNCLRSVQVVSKCRNVFSNNPNLDLRDSTVNNDSKDVKPTDVALSFISKLSKYLADERLSDLFYVITCAASRCRSDSSSGNESRISGKRRCHPFEDACAGTAADWALHLKEEKARRGAASGHCSDSSSYQLPSLQDSVSVSTLSSIDKGLLFSVIA